MYSVVDQGPKASMPPCPLALPHGSWPGCSQATAKSPFWIYAFQRGQVRRNL